MKVNLTVRQIIYLHNVIKGEVKSLSIEAFDEETPQSERPLGEYAIMKEILQEIEEAYDE